MSPEEFEIDQRNTRALAKAAQAEHRGESIASIRTALKGVRRQLQKTTSDDEKARLLDQFAFLRAKLRAAEFDANRRIEKKPVPKVVDWNASGEEVSEPTPNLVLPPPPPASTTVDTRKHDQDLPATVAE